MLAIEPIATANHALQITVASLCAFDPDNFFSNGSNFRDWHHVQLLMRSHCVVGSVRFQAALLGAVPTECSLLLCRASVSEAGLLKQLFSKYATPAVDYIMEGIDAGELVQKVKLTIPVTSLNLITQLCHLLDTLLKESSHYTDPNVSSATLLTRQSCI